MPKFNDLYLSTTPISNTFLPFAIAGQNVTEDGKTHNTPLLEIKNLMVDAVKTLFAELEETGKFNCKLMPSTVFGKYDNGTNKYNEVGRFISQDVIDFLNDQYGEYKWAGFENMFDELFRKQLKFGDQYAYLRVFSRGKENAIYKRTRAKVLKLFEQANYQIPLIDDERDEFKKIFRDAYFDLIEGIIKKETGHPVSNYDGLHIIEKPSDMQIALQMIRNNEKFNAEDFSKTEGLNDTDNFSWRY